MSTKKKMLLAAAGAGAGGGLELAIEEVFSTYLYTGNSTEQQTITNGIDLAGEGGLLWIKNRTNHANSGNNLHLLFDTDRGTDKYLFSNLNNGEVTSSALLSSFNADGFTLNTGAASNESGVSFASWTFRKAPRFFDVVTYTGDGTTGRQISHNLDHTVGAMILKETSGSGSWGVYHRSVDATAPENYVLLLNSTSARIDEQFFINDTAPTSTHFTVGAAAASGGDFNTNGDTYVAYLFAHDPLGPSEDGSDGLIACGSVSYSPGVEVDLGWEPQWILMKRTDGSQNWFLVDTTRSWTADGNAVWFAPNLSDAESAFQQFGFQLTSTGFKVTPGYGNGANIIYIAIRRGPMRQPTSGTEVFDVVADTATFSPSNVMGGVLTDWMFGRARVADGAINWFQSSRLSPKTMAFNGTGAEQSTQYVGFDRQAGIEWENTWTTTSGTYASWYWRRAPGFFDVVAYTGDGVAGRTVSHNLGVAPEMMIVKARSNTTDWEVYHSGLDATAPQNYSIKLNDNAGVIGISRWFSTAPTDSVFSVGGNNTNQSGTTYIAYLFATLPGVSKVGSYTGNGTSQTINCGFTSGARFILIKRTDASSNWKVMDTARGIVVGDDKVLELDNTAAETTFDLVDPDPSGFIVEGNTTQGMNQSGASYIFYAIA